MFNTLNEALESVKDSRVDLVAEWPIGTNINYGQTQKVDTDGWHISVYRSDTGMYEAPIYYRKSKKRKLN